MTVKSLKIFENNIKHALDTEFSQLCKSEIFKNISAIEKVTTRTASA